MIAQLNVLLAAESTPATSCISNKTTQIWPSQLTRPSADTESKCKSVWRLSFCSYTSEH